MWIIGMNGVRGNELGKEGTYHIEPLMNVGDKNDLFQHYIFRCPFKNKLQTSVIWELSTCSGDHKKSKLV